MGFARLRFTACLHGIIKRSKSFTLVRKSASVELQQIIIITAIMQIVLTLSAKKLKFRSVKGHGATSPISSDSQGQFAISLISEARKKQSQKHFGGLLNINYPVAPSNFTPTRTLLSYTPMDRQKQIIKSYFFNYLLSLFSNGIYVKKQ